MYEKSNKNYDFSQKQKRWKEMVHKIGEEILPQDGKDYKKIM